MAEIKKPKVSKTREAIRIMWAATKVIVVAAGVGYLLAIKMEENTGSVPSSCESHTERQHRLSQHPHL